jgi:hypothetical protein
MGLSIFQTVRIAEPAISRFSPLSLAAGLGRAVLQSLFHPVPESRLPFLHFRTDGTLHEPHLLSIIDSADLLLKLYQSD